MTGILQIIDLVIYVVSCCQLCICVLYLAKIFQIIMIKKRFSNVNCCFKTYINIWSNSKKDFGGVRKIYNEKIFTYNINVRIGLGNQWSNFDTFKPFKLIQKKSSGAPQFMIIQRFHPECDTYFDKQNKRQQFAFLTL